MRAAVQFLDMFAQALAAVALYASDHPARGRAVEPAYAGLRALQIENPRPLFSFPGEDVVYEHTPLGEMRGWPWAARLSSAGIQRLQFSDTITPAQLAALLEEVIARLAAPGQRARRPGMLDGVGAGALVAPAERAGSGHSAVGSVGEYGIAEELQTVAWLYGEAEGKDRLAVAEAEAVVRSLAVAMRADGPGVLPPCLRATTEYAAQHAINVAMLVMALATDLGLGERGVHAFGLAGLLYDIGMSRLPSQMTNNGGAFTEAERLLIQRHPVEGARLILRSDGSLDLAAVVAYEHHIRPDGGGYPALRVPRSCHYASRLVRICDVYDALCTERPYRAAWTSDTALRYIELFAGSEFDADIVRVFAARVRAGGSGVRETA